MTIVETKYEKVLYPGLNIVFRPRKYSTLSRGRKLAGKIWSGVVVATEDPMSRTRKLGTGSSPVRTKPNFSFVVADGRTRRMYLHGQEHNGRRGRVHLLSRNIMRSRLLVLPAGFINMALILLWGKTNGSGPLIALRMGG